MKKKDLINALAAKFNDLTKKDAGIIIESLGEVIAEALTEGKTVTIPCVGKLYVQDYPARAAVISFGEHKGERYQVPPKKNAKLNPSTKLKDMLNA